MTRKDFQAIADIIAEVGPGGANDVWLAGHFADMLATTNPRFDRDKFVRACGVGELARN
jgi:hypothetical protein